MKFAIIIPASMESKRLPGKPLLKLKDGAEMLWHVWNNAVATKASKVVVASSNSDVILFARKKNWRQCTSTNKHESGTSRCAEALRYNGLGGLGDCDLIVNWQVDEPFLSLDHVNRLVEMVSSWTPEQRETTIGTIVAPPGGDLCPHCSFGMKQRRNTISACPDCFGGRSRHVVKVAADLLTRDQNKCYWFSRAPMVGAWNHVGVYCYHRDLLMKLAELPRSQIAKEEGLEQLDWLVAGYNIRATVIDKAPLSINTMWDYERAIREGSV